MKSYHRAFLGSCLTCVLVLLNSPSQSIRLAVYVLGLVTAALFAIAPSDTGETK